MDTPNPPGLTLVLSAGSIGAPHPVTAHSEPELPQPILSFLGTLFRPIQMGGKGRVGEVWHQRLLSINKTVALGFWQGCLAE